jgi:hypothetical protein
MVPRQCPLVLLVEVRLREGKALGSEKGKALGSGLCYEQRKAEALLCISENWILTLARLHYSDD